MMYGTENYSNRDYYYDGSWKAVQPVRTPIRIDKTSPAYARASKAGFVFNSAEKLELSYLGSYEYRGTMTCVCGKEEHWRWSSNKDEIKNKSLDIATALEKVGAFGIKHLRGDGYSPQQIREIRSAFV